MRFLLVGDHPDGLDMAQALVATGRHHLVAHVGPSKAAEALRRRGMEPARIGDLEEALADPAVEAVIVAGSLDDRPAQLRRALQSERPVLCVHPADRTPDAAYEAALIQGDTGRLLLPLLPETLHPGVRRLVELLRDPGAPLGDMRLVEVERCAPGPVLIEATGTDATPSLPGWDVLRAVGGEIAEVSAYAPGEHATAEDPVLVAGRFERGGLFQVSLVPGDAEPRWRLAVLGTAGQAELDFAGGWPGPALLRWHAKTAAATEQTWDAWDPWPALVQVFDAALASGGRQPPDYRALSATGCGGRQPPDSSLASGGRQPPDSRAPSAPGSPHQAAHAPGSPGRPLTWQEAVRCLELDEAARRSIQRRRTSALEYQEVSEVVGFKGTMTLVGCGLLWLMIVLAIGSRWFAPLGWAVLPLLATFLGLQLLRYVIPTRPRMKDEG